MDVVWTVGYLPNRRYYRWISMDSVQRLWMKTIKKCLSWSCLKWDWSCGGQCCCCPSTLFGFCPVGRHRVRVTTLFFPNLKKHHLGTIRTTSQAGTMWFLFCLEPSLLFWSLIFCSPNLGLNKRSRQGEPQLFKGRSLFLVKASMFDTVPALWQKLLIKPNSLVSGWW